MYLINTFFVARHALTGARKDWVHAPLVPSAAARTHTRLIVVDSSIDVGLLHPRNHFREGVLSVHLRRLGIGVVTRKTDGRTRLCARRLRPRPRAPVPRPARGWWRRWRNARAARLEGDAVAHAVGHLSTRARRRRIGLRVVRPRFRDGDTLYHHWRVVGHVETPDDLSVGVDVKGDLRRLHVAL